MDAPDLKDRDRSHSVAANAWKLTYRDNSAYTFRADALQSLLSRPVQRSQLSDSIRAVGECILATTHAGAQDRPQLTKQPSPKRVTRDPQIGQRPDRAHT